MQFPEHKCGLFIQHQPHIGNVETPQEWAADNDARSYADWISDEARAESMRTGQIWTVQWYPVSIGGFYCLAGPNLEDVLVAARTHEDRK